jgi:hypothetical protein
MRIRFELGDYIETTSDPGVSIWNEPIVTVAVAAVLVPSA